MKCQFCGAEYSDGEVKCPYCGSENHKEAERRYQDKLKELNREEQQIRRLPRILINKSVKIVLVVSAAAVIVIILASMITLAIGKTKAENKYQMQQNQLVDLEKYYEDGSYLEIYEYMKANSIDGNSYLKYEEIGEASFYQNQVEEAIKEMKNTQEKASESMNIVHLSMIILDASRGIKICRQGVENNGIISNKERLEGIERQIRETLVTEFDITEEELKKLEVMEGKQKDYESIAQQILERSQP